MKSLGNKLLARAESSTQNRPRHLRRGCVPRGDQGLSAPLRHAFAQNSRLSQILPHGWAEGQVLSGGACRSCASAFSAARRERRFRSRPRRRRIELGLKLLTLSLLWLGELQAVQAEPVNFELAPSSGALIGAPVEIRGMVRYPEKYALSADLAGQTTGAFTIVKAEMDPAQAAQGTKTQAIRLTVVPFDLGSQTLPPLPWTLRDGSGNAQTIQSPPVKLDVSGPPAAAAQDIRDIKPPLSPAAWPFVLLGFLAAAALGWVFWALRRRRSRRTQEIAAALQDTRPPHVIALDELQKLRESDLPAKEYYIRLTDILRIYLERHFGIPATVLTTGDLIRQMRQAEMDQNIVSEIREVFDRSDLVKFAKFLPEHREKRRDVEEAIEIVHQTAPPEPAPPTAPGKIQ